MKLKYVKQIAIATFGLSLIPVIFYLIKFTGGFSSQQQDWGTFGDYIGGLLNPFISFLTLIITAYIAYLLYDYEDRKDKKEKEQADIKSYVELYQYFTSTEFREKRHTAWNVIRRAIKCPEYAEFIVKENFVGRYINRMSRHDVFEKFKFIYTDSVNDEKTFLQKESEDRHKVDSVVNFFQLLAIKDVPNENYKVCDFYYDSWRPILCWYAKKLEEGYNAYELNKKYSNKNNLRAAIALLDEKYYKPEILDTITVDTIENHPIIKWYADKNHNE